MSIRVIRLVIHMKYWMHSAGSFGLLIKVNVTFRNADQMCMCFVSVIYSVCVCVGGGGSRNKVLPFKRNKKANKEISHLCLLPRLSLTKYTTSQLHLFNGVQWLMSLLYSSDTIL